jgi:3-deoxy-7-phosphoheptulonate synthase
MTYHPLTCAGRAGQCWASGTRLDSVPSPGELLDAIPLTGHAATVVSTSRAAVRRVLNGEDDRLIAIIGPCSVHDPAAALEYGHWLAAKAREHSDQLVILMRAYTEKPRTAFGWKGLINDPWLDGSCDIPAGLRIARSLYLELAGIGVPVATEWLEPQAVPYLTDAVTWGTIGARTTQSQVHRQLASGMPMPVGFKNDTSGHVQPAIDACRVAATGHTFLSAIAGDGSPARACTPGNPDCCVILRGGRTGPNYRQPYVRAALSLLGRAGLPRRVIIDASHGNSGKDYLRQVPVTLSVTAQVASGEPGITGLMLESFLQQGRQDLGADPSRLTYGQSVTDGCLDLAATATALDFMADAVNARRHATRSAA